MSNSNNKINISSISLVTEYLYDDYLEYFYNVNDKFFNYYKRSIYEQIIGDEQVKFLEFMLEKYPLNTDELWYYLKRYRGKENPEQILNLYFKYDKALKYRFEKGNDIFGDVLRQSSLEYVKVFSNMMGENLNKNMKINLGNYRINSFYDHRVFAWLFETNRFNINPDDNWIEWIKSEIKSETINQDNIDNILELIKFDKTNLKEIFVVINTNYNSIISYLVQNKKNEFIYYFFDKLEPKDIIHEWNVRNIIIDIIKYNNYELFMFFIKHIFQLKYKSTFYNNSTVQVYGSTAYEYIDTVDKKILYELVKLGYTFPKASKYYNYYGNITIGK